MPDLSHLDEAERKIIEDVIRRQQEEEDKEQDMIRYKLPVCFDGHIDIGVLSRKKKRGGGCNIYQFNTRFKK